MTDKSSETRFRWAEILITVVVSAGGSAFAAAWSVSATLAKMQMQLESIQSKQSIQESTIANLSSQAASQTTQIAVADTNYKNILVWLSEIKEELKRRK